MDQMLRSGTLADRVAAMTLRVQQSPVHGLGVIDSLLKLCGKVRSDHRNICRTHPHANHFQNFYEA